MTLTHLEPEEFIAEAFADKATIEVQPVVMDSGKAGMVYLFKDASGSICFNDRLYTADGAYMNENVHAELYRKVAMMNPVLHA